jgi:predicted Rossmann fold flavoprotein
MCAISAGFRGRRVLVLEKGPKCGLKILVSGGGRCNFTHLDADPREHYLSENPHFCLSAMRRFTPRDFLAMVEAAGIAYHEKTPGQLFCDNSAQDILDMLLQQCEMAGVTIRLREAVESLRPGPGGGFEVRTASRAFTAPRVVLACGGLSLPKIGQRPGISRGPGVRPGGGESPGGAGAADLEQRGPRTVRRPLGHLAPGARALWLWHVFMTRCSSRTGA